MFRGSENCVRTPPAARLVDPEESASRSSRQTPDPGLGEMERDARPDGAAADDDDLRVVGELRSSADEIPQEEQDVRRTLGQSAHEIGVPVGPERRRHEHLVPRGGDASLQCRTYAVEHLQLEAVAADALRARRTRECGG